MPSMVAWRSFCFQKRQDLLSAFKGSWLSWLLILGLGLPLLIVANMRTPLPGMSGAIMALLATIVGFRPTSERTAWIILVAGCLLTELHAIRSDRTRSDSEQAAFRKNESKKFQKIADDLRHSIDQSKLQYLSTKGDVDDVLVKTKDIAATAQRSLDDISGAGSHPCVVPDYLAMEGTNVPFAVWNRGRNVLTGVEISIHNMRSYQAARFSGREERVSIGTITGEWAKTMPAIVPELEADGIGHYMAEIWTQNGYYTEMINFRRARGGKSVWAFQYWGSKQELATGHDSRKGHFLNGRLLIDCQQPRWSDEASR